MSEDVRQFAKADHAMADPVRNAFSPAHRAEDISAMYVLHQELEPSVDLVRHHAERTPAA